MREGSRIGPKVYVSRGMLRRDRVPSVDAMTTTARQWLARVDPRLLDAAVAVALLALLLASFGRPPGPGQRPIDLGAWLLAAGLTLPYAIHRRAPWIALTLTLSSLVAFSLLHYAPYPGISMFALLFAITLHGTRKASVTAYGATIAAFLVALAAQPPGVARPADWAATLLAATVAWLAGANVRQRRTRWAALEERTMLLEREREERDRAAVTTERLRIARELHDVVAHSMSVIAVQAGVGHHVIDTDVAEARRALGAIEDTSRSSLTEMRRLLGVLRESDDAASRSPAHGLGDLARLVAQTRRSGLGVTLERSGSDHNLPAGADLAAYRIVQEGLTNVLKHGGPVAHVLVECTDRVLSIEITDDGGPRGSTDAADGAGHGLIGMRERETGLVKAHPLPPT
jgi:signal transduction histidine kinase